MFRNIPKIFTPNKKNENNSLTSQAQFIEQEQEQGETGIPPRALTATKELEEQVEKSNNEGMAVTQVTNRDAIIAKSKQLTDQRVKEVAMPGNTKEYRSPLMATSLEQHNLETVHQSAVPVIEVNNLGEETMDSVIINSEYITKDEELYTQEKTHSNPNNSNSHRTDSYPVNDIMYEGNGTTVDPDIDEDAEIAAIMEQLDKDPYADTSEFGKEIVEKSTSVKVVYDHNESVKTVTYHFGIPISKFLDIYEMEVASQGYFCSEDVNGTHVTVNPNKCYTIEIFE